MGFTAALTTPPIYLTTSKFSADIETPTISLDGRGTLYPPTSAELSVPDLSLTARTGASFIQVTPDITASFSGTIDNISSLDALVPKITLSTTASIGTLGNSNLIYNPTLTLSAYAGGLFSNNAPTLSLSVTGAAENLGYAALKVPSFTVASTISVRYPSYANLTVPKIYMTSGIFDVTWSGKYTITATASGTITLSSEAYVMNTANNGLSHYDNFQFDNIITVDGSNYGVKADGLYLLGADDDADTNIDAEFETSPTSSKEISTTSYLYITARSDANFTASAVCDEVEKTGKLSILHKASSPYNYRVQFGKGVKGVNWGYKVVNVDGSDFQIQSIEPRTVKNKRRI